VRDLRQAGFTLVELLVCTAIIALLATLAVPRVLSAVTVAREAQVQADLKLINTALEQYFVDRGHYPVRLGVLTERGYLPRRMSLESPISGHWYFYAVDDNTDTDTAHAFILGAPPQNAGDDNDLFHEGPLPRGKWPGVRANAWVQSNGETLWLYSNEDQNRLPQSAVPRDLSDYRNSCKPASVTLCDLRTN